MLTPVELMHTDQEHGDPNSGNGILWSVCESCYPKTRQDFFRAQKAARTNGGAVGGSWRRSIVGCVCV